MENDDYKSPALEAAIAMHEMYLTFMQAGFTETQALKMVIELLRQQLS